MEERYPIVSGLAKKQQTVESLKDVLDGAAVAFVVDYRGLTVSQLTELRRELYKNDAQLTVMKNTMLKRAVEGTEMEPLTEFLAGPTALAIGRSDQVVPIKVVKKYLKDHKMKNEVRGGVLDGKALSEAEVTQLATLPSLDELRGKLLGGIASPLNGLVAAISGPQRGLVNVLDQYAARLQQQGA